MVKGACNPRVGSVVGSTAAEDLAAVLDVVGCVALVLTSQKGSP